MEDIAVGAAAAFAVIVALTALLGPVCGRAGQPLVVGQLLAGILLGPSGLGRLPGHLTSRMFPPAALPCLSVAAEAGLVLFLFSVGCELDLSLLRGGTRPVAAVATGALLLPLALGAGVGLAAWHGLVPGVVRSKPEPAVVLFLAVALSITAVPVLAAILRESALLGTRAGAVALASAGAMDVAGWVLLAVAITMAGTGRPVTTTLAWLSGYIVVMVAAGRPALAWWLRREPHRSGSQTTLVLAAAFASAWATGYAGLQVIFGALFFGLMMPRDGSGRCEADARRAATEAGQVLLPLFFVVTGLSVNLGTLDGPDYAVLAVLTLTAVAGKLVGGALAARAVRLDRRESAVIGILVSTRGLTELIAVTAGRSAGLIDASGYTLLVLMVLITTALTGPLLRLAKASRLITVTCRQAPRMDATAAR